MKIFITEMGKILGYLEGGGNFNVPEKVVSFEVELKNIGRYKPISENGKVVGVQIDESIIIDEENGDIVETGQTIKDRTEMLEKENEALKQSQSEQDILLMQLLLGGN
ncbi:hypothetical protein [Alkalihalophilus marmarensis]|uniref:hypothetical protein n=1 Tax=Alkalihalophilus marmarensis TaxID=521377 RepID=UPI002DB7D080|nr:hypothetical protein [Alkalihalophilus marmarensis]MEC2070348.1 hypothetical protein [Alkalihalophilus marmarensis]